ncbi:SYTL1 protein, partial [Setophaga kirtlandii]|nr:SYTL1 protein [Setophaga kirtlandii]
LDLSFLTEEERSCIARVLRRDWQLRRREEGRVSKLRKSVSDPALLRSLTGDWFSDARAQRHQHPLGSDLVRASIRRRRRPRGTRGALGGTGTGGRTGPGPLSSPVSPGTGELEHSPSLEAIDEPPAEEREDEDGALETHGSSPPEEVQEAAEPQVGPCWGVEQVTSPRRSRRARPSQVSETGSVLGGLGVGDPQPRRDPPPATPAPWTPAHPLSLQGTREVPPWARAAQRRMRRRRKSRTRHTAATALGRYIKTYLLPDKSNRSKRKTAVRKRSLDPVFNETLKYKLEKRDLQGRTLNLSVWHHDSLGRNLFLGEVEVALGTWDWANTRPEWFSLQPRVSCPPPDPPWVHVPLTPLPAGAGMPPTGELHIWVKDAQGLIPLQSGTVDAFVQCYVLPDDSKASRQKINHTMVYDGFQARDLAEACAEFTLWHHEAFSKRQLGGIRLSLGTGESRGVPRMSPAP